MSRFRKLTRKDLVLPACSMVSRTDDDEWFLDLGISTEDGAAYLGSRDFTEAAAVAGFWSNEEIAKIEARNEGD